MTPTDNIAETLNVFAALLQPLAMVAGSNSNAVTSAQTNCPVLAAMAPCPAAKLRLPAATFSQPPGTVAWDPDATFVSPPPTVARLPDAWFTAPPPTEL